MAFILNIETATTVCSVSVSNKEKVLSFKEINNGYSHAENLHVYISEVLNQANLTPTQLNAVAVSKGPGSYTGLRIGVSAAKGMAYALNIPLVSVDTLQLMSAAAKKNESTFYCPMLDARRMEVYTCVYDQRLNPVEKIQAVIIDEISVQQFSKFESVCFFGDGMPKCKNLLQELKNATFKEDITPSSKFMPQFAYKKFTENDFEDVAYFEPYYLKEFFSTAKK